MIYDCFVFFNELDLLEIRLNELNNIVDKFILVESNKTFSGKDKPLYYEINKQRFEKFHHKIIHIIVTDMPGTGAWNNEYFQRDCISRGLPNFPEGKEGDYIIISDVDEIVKASTLKSILPIKEPTRFYMKPYTKYINCDVGGEWYYPVILPYYKLNRSINQIRQEQDGIRINNGGWHFSYLGGSQGVRSKLEAFSHQEFNTPCTNNRAKLELAIKYPMSILNSNLEHQTIRPITEELFPKYLVDNQEKFKHLIATKQYMFKEYAIEYPKENTKNFMNPDECNWLFNIVTDYNKVICLGSYISVHIILAGMNWKGKIYASKKYLDEILFNNLYGKKENITYDEIQEDVDFFFADGGRRYKENKEELQLAKIKTKKIIAGFGYDQPEIKKAVNETFPSVDLIGRIWAVVL